MNRCLPSVKLEQARNLVKEGFGNQINLCRDRGLNPGPLAQKSDTLLLDHQVTDTNIKSQLSCWWLRPPGNPREHIKTLDKQVKLKRKLELQEYVEAQEASMEHRRAIFKSHCLGLCEAKRNMKVEIKRLKLESENINNTLRDVGNMLEYPITDLEKDKENIPGQYFETLSDSLIGSRE
uniref:Uncharacterized protein n=1 Tax=Timema genevievae TaxID=629358 RepID=A0A7R9K442_TIMGE|nr:unnamed protein product [Timema genevievae]